MGIKIKKDGVWVPVSQGGINNVGLSALVNHGTVSTSSGTEAAFTGIPSTAKKILVSIHRISHAGTHMADQLIMEVGDSNGYVQTGYESSYQTWDTVSDVQNNTTFYGLSNGHNSNYNYSYNIELVHVTGNSWTISHVGGSSQSTGAISTGAGSITLSNSLDKLRIKTQTGLTFDNGTITVYYQTEGTVGSSTGGTSSGSSGSSSNYESSIISLNGNNQAEFADIPSWATKITLVGENVLLPQTDSDAVGSNLEFGGSSGYLAANSYAYNLHYGTLEDTNLFNSGLAEVNNTPYTDAIILYGSGSHVNYPILSQVFITFQKVKGQNKWVYKGSASNRKGDPSTTTIDQKWLNNFTGSFTSTEAITKLKFYSYKGSAYAAGSTNYTGGSITTIYEGESTTTTTSSNIKVATIVDQKQSLTAGGDSQTSWTDRELNTKNDPDSIVSLSGSNYFSLSPGTYRIKWSAPAYRVNRHQTRLVYSTTSSFTSTTEVYGSSEYNALSYSQQTRSFGETIVVLENTTYFKIQHKCQTAITVNGFGLASEFADEIYTQVFVEDLTILGGGGGSNLTPLQRLQTETLKIIRDSQTLQIPSNVGAVKIWMMGGGGAGFTATNTGNNTTFWMGGGTARVYEGIFNVADLTTNNQLTITIGGSGYANPSSTSPASTPGGSTTIVGTEKTLVAPGGHTYGYGTGGSNVNYWQYPNNDTASSELTEIYSGQSAFWGSYCQGAISANVSKDKGAIILWYATYGGSGSSSSSGGGNISYRTERILTAGSGTYTFHPNLVYAKVYLLGGGGYGGSSTHASAGAGGNGGPGALAYRIYTAIEAGTTASYTIGGDSTFTVTGTASADVLTAGAGGSGGSGTFGGGGATAYPIGGSTGSSGSATNSFLDFTGPTGGRAQGFGSTNGRGGIGGAAGGGSGSAGGPGAMYIEEYYST